jgi:hypothetical protein
MEITMTIKIMAAKRLQVAFPDRVKDNEDLLQLLDPVSDSLNHALTTLNKVKSKLGNDKLVMTLTQAIKESIVDLQVLQEELEV